MAKSAFPVAFAGASSRRWFGNDIDRGSIDQCVRGYSQTGSSHTSDFANYQPGNDLW